MLHLNDTEKRALGLMLMDASLSVEEIAKVISGHPQAAHKFVRKYRGSGHTFHRAKNSILSNFIVSGSAQLR